MLNKKSQTAIFMIMGLVIVIGGVIFFYSTQKIHEPFEPEVKIVQEEIPLEFSPIREYVNSCMYSLGQEGLKIMGEQGGYISLADKNLNREAFTITQNPTESDAVVFAKDSDFKIPYWWYLKSANNCRGDCKFASKRPDLRQSENSIEKQLERYIDLKLKDCINNFAPFQAQGIRVSEAGKIKADVTIAQNDVVLIVDYPLNAQSGDVKSKLSQFVVRLPVNLDKVYDLATKIANMEMKHRYLEKHALNLVVAFSGVDKERLPPMSDMQFKFGSSTSWKKTEVKNKITALLVSYVPLFQVDGTYNYERNTFNSELRQRLYDSTIIPVSNSSFKDLSAYFTYLDFWPAYFDLNCKGEKCTPSSANSLISTFGIQQYRFVYDLSFPVLVEVQDPFAFNGQGYSFNFFLEGNIRNNKPMPADFVPFEKASLSESSLLCDSRTSGNITVNVVNAATKKPVDNAQVLYSVADESCFIGETGFDGVLREQFPTGIGGYLTFVRDGYIGKTVDFDPRPKESSQVMTQLQPISTKKLIVRKKNVARTASGWQFIDSAVDLSGKESASVTLARIGDSELEFQAFANYEGSQKEPSEIELGPGNYAAEINLLLDERVIIPEKQKCVKKNIFGSKECFTVPKIDFGEKSAPGQERFPEGGLRLNFTINAESLQNHDTLVLYAVSIDLAGIPEQNRVVEDVEQMGKIEEYSRTYQLALQPEFK